MHEPEPQFVFEKPFEVKRDNCSRQQLRLDELHERLNFGIGSKTIQVHEKLFALAFRH